MDDDFFATAEALRRMGRPFATATVVRVEKPTSARPGDKAIVTLEGELYGWVGGSCSQPTVVEEAAKALREDRSRLIRLSSTPEEGGREGLTDRAMTCFSGGTMEIFIEPHQPRLRLLVVGDLPVARALAALGRVMGYRVIGVDAAGQGAALPGADETLDGVEAIAGQVTPLTFVVVATHGDHDEVAVEHALRARAPYVGLVASRKRAGSIVEYLRSRGLADVDLAPLHAPAGLDIQARGGDEIALSIVAEIVHTRRTLPALEWTRQGEAAEGASEPAAAAEGTAAGAGSAAVEGGATASAARAAQAAAAGAVAAPEAAAQPMPETALDPVCGMTVKVAGARHRHEHQGATYFFCCGGCLAKFSADPARYLAQSGDAEP